MRFRWRVALAAITITVILIYTLSNFSSHDVKTITEKQPLRDYVLEQKVESESPRKYEQLVSTAVKPNIFIPNNSESVQNAKKTFLKTFRGPIPMYVYPPEVDNMISSRLRSHGTWEEDMLNVTGSLLLKSPDWTFVDIGCNIGVYTLFIAKLGVPVVCIEPVRNNLILLTKSLEASNLSDLVILVNNAISDKRRNASVFIPDQNVGGAYIQDGGNNQHSGQPVQTIALDDLTNLLQGRNVFMKIDIEGHENKALSSGNLFFQSVGVKGILMEWVHHRYTDTGTSIIKVLVNNGLLPYEDGQRNNLLDPDRSHRWPENIFWFKR